MVFMSTMILSPETGWAYGLPSGVARHQMSHQPSRRSRYCSGISAWP